MARIRLNQTKVISSAHKAAGPHIKRTSELILGAARRMAPSGNHLSGSGRRQQGQKLKASLVNEVRTGVDYIVRSVGSRKNYAASEHQGSEPHVIRGKGKMLKFKWERGDMLVTARRRGRISSRYPRRNKNGFFYFVKVKHPGNKRPVRYLTTPMHLFGRMRGFRTDSWPVGRSRLP